MYADKKILTHMHRLAFPQRPIIIREQTKWKRKKPKSDPAKRGICESGAAPEMLTPPRDRDRYLIATG